MMRLSSSLRRFRWLVFVGWVLALIPALYLVLTSSGHLTGGGFEVPGSQSLRVHDQLEAHYPDQGTSPLALVAAPRADASYEDMNAAAGFLQQVAKQMPDVVVVPNPAQPSPQPDRPYVVSLRLDGANNNSASDAAKKLRVKIGVQGERPGQMQNGRVRLYVIGQGALSTAAAANTKHDIAKAEQWNLPIILIVLLAVFGSLAAAAIPLALGIVTVIITMGLVYLLSAYTTMSVFVTSTVSMFGIALAVDYSLFILMRFREELRAGRQPQEAVDAAMATSGLAVALSGMTVVASLTGIYLIDTPALASMATGAILAVAVAMLTSTTMTPAVLATFGRSAAKRSAAAALVAAPGNHPVAVLDTLDRRGDAPAVVVGGAGFGSAARHGGARDVDGVGQQPASSIQLVARDPGRGVGGVRGAGSRRARPGAGVGDLPRRRRVVGNAHPGDRRDPRSDRSLTQHPVGGPARLRR